MIIIERVYYYKPVYYPVTNNNWCVLKFFYKKLTAILSGNEKHYCAEEMKEFLRLSNLLLDFTFSTSHFKDTRIRQKSKINCAYINSKWLDEIQDHIEDAIDSVDADGKLSKNFYHHSEALMDTDSYLNILRDHFQNWTYGPPKTAKQVLMRKTSIKVSFCGIAQIISTFLADPDNVTMLTKFDEAAVDNSVVEYFHPLDNSNTLSYDLKRKAENNDSSDSDDED